MHSFKDEGDYSYAMKQLCGDRFCWSAMRVVLWIHFLDRSQHRV